MRANVAPDLRPDQRLTDPEVIAQITTFMLAGNETSSTALTWLLFRLAQNPDVQKRLRDECLSIDDPRPPLATVEALPYLDKCLHEILRFDGPVPGTIRQAMVDAVIPLSKPIKGVDGTLLETVHVPKGQEIFIREY
jgi:cytochrome P450